MAGAGTITRSSCPSTRSAAVSGANKKEKGGATLPWLQGGGSSMA